MNLGKRIIVTVFYQRREQRGNETIVYATIPDLCHVCLFSVVK